MNKNYGIVAAAGVAVVGSLLYWFYRQYQNQQSEQVVQQSDRNFEKQILVMKNKLRQSDSLENVKKAIALTFQYIKECIYEYSKEFKKKRTQYNRVTRKQKMGDYMKMVLEGMTQIEKMGLYSQEHLMKQVGITQVHIQRYQYQLEPFIKEQMMLMMRPRKQSNKISFTQAQRAMRLQIEYLKENAASLAERIVDATQKWNANDKSKIFTLLSVVLADEVFEDEPDLDEEALQAAELEYQYQLVAQMTELHQVIPPLVIGVSQGLGVAMQGMPNQNQDMGMGMGGLSNEQLEEQIQRLQTEHPLIYQQMMAQAERMREMAGFRR